VKLLFEMSVWETVEIYDPPVPANTSQPGVTTWLLYSGSKFTGHQKSKGNSYDVVVNLQVCCDVVCSKYTIHVSLLSSLQGHSLKFTKATKVALLTETY